MSPFAKICLTQFNIKRRFIDILLNFAQMFSKSSVLYVEKGNIGKLKLDIRT